MSLDDTVALAIRSLFAAADEDVATGGPDLVRGIFPLVAAIDAQGFRALPDDDVEQRSRALLEGPERGGGDHRMNMPFYVSPEQVMKDRADYAAEGHRPRSQPRGARVRGGHAHRRRQPLAHACRRSARSTTASRSRRSASTTSSRCCASPGSATPTSRATRTPAKTCRRKELANAYAQTLGQVFTHEMKPYEVELLVAEVGRTGDDHAEMYHLFYDGVVIDEQSLLGPRRPGRADHRGAREPVHRRHGAGRRVEARRAACSAPTARHSAPISSKWRCSSGHGRRSVPPRQGRRAQRAPRRLAGRPSGAGAG